VRSGGGKQKGAQFERDICRRLSLWVSHNKQEDLFWRSAMSGGRATVAKRKSITLSSQAGDISAVDKAGHVLTTSFYFELKHVKAIGLDSFIIKNNGPLAGYWHTACKEAAKYNKIPIIIVRQNRFPVLLVTRRGIGHDLIEHQLGLGRGARCEIRPPTGGTVEVWLFETLLKYSFGYRP
jgi:hypothetical protein